MASSEGQEFVPQEESSSSALNTTSLVPLTILVAEEEIEGFKQALETVSTEKENFEKSTYCCYITIREPYFGETNKSIRMEANDIDQARLKCMKAAYDEWQRLGGRPNVSVGATARQGGCVPF